MFGCGLGWVQGTLCLTGVQIPMQSSNFEGEKGRNIVLYRDPLPWAVQSGWTNQDAVLDMDSGGSKETCIRWGCTLAPSGEYDWTVHVRWRCGLMSNYSITCWSCLFVTVVWWWCIQRRSINHILNLNLSLWWYKKLGNWAIGRNTQLSLS